MIHMKLSIITDEFTQDLSEAIAFAKEYSLSALELRTIGDQPLEMISRDRLCEISCGIHEAGLVVSDLAASLCKCLYRDREKENGKLEQLIEAAKILGTSSIRGFGFFSEGAPDRQTVAKALRGPLKRLEEEGMELLLEADPSVTTTNHRMLRELIEETGCPNLGAIYDPGNDIWDPEGEKPFPDGWNEIRPYVRHIHIKDAVMTPEGAQAVKVGSGSVPFLPLLREVKRSGYQGFLSLEVHYRLEKDLSEEQMKRPGGAAFSNGGLMACRESMEELQKMLQRI